MVARQWRQKRPDLKWQLPIDFESSEWKKFHEDGLKRIKPRGLPGTELIDFVKETPLYVEILPLDSVNELRYLILQDIPPIVIFDKLYYEKGMHGPGHAVVLMDFTRETLVGIDPENDPRFVTIYLIKRFAEAWKNKGNYFIYLGPPITSKSIVVSQTRLSDVDISNAVKPITEDLEKLKTNYTRIESDFQKIKPEKTTEPLYKQLQSEIKNLGDKLAEDFKKIEDLPNQIKKQTMEQYDSFLKEKGISALMGALGPTFLHLQEGIINYIGAVRDDLKRLDTKIGTLQTVQSISTGSPLLDVLFEALLIFTGIAFGVFAVTPLYFASTQSWLIFTFGVIFLMGAIIVRYHIRSKKLQ